MVRSFALHAPPAARLLVKEHPIDNGLTPWRRLLRETAARHGAGGAARGLVAAGIPVGLEGPEAAHGSDAVCAAAQPAAELDCAGAEAAAVE